MLISLIADKYGVKRGDVSLKPKNGGYSLYVKDKHVKDFKDNQELIGWIKSGIPRRKKK